jgi:hypothetical protein
MLNCKESSEVSFLETNHYKLYLKGKLGASWDTDLDWSVAANDNLPERLKSTAVDVASMSAQVEVLGMRNAAQLLIRCDDFALRIGLGQAVSDEARHAELFAKYALLANGTVRDFTKTRDKYEEHFTNLRTFDEIFLSHVFLENGALEQFNIFVQTFGEQSLIGKIYKGALQDEARHLKMGVTYFRAKAELDHEYADFVERHIRSHSSLLEMNDNAAKWLSELSQIPVLELNSRATKRHESFLSNVLASAHV